MRRQGDNPQPPKFFWNADSLPGHFTLPPIAGFIPGPEESAAPLVNGFDDSHGEETRTHRVREHRGEDRVDKNKAPANRKTPSSPTRETHVTFGHDGGKVSEAQLVGG